jgi:hypothetical protein
LRHLDHRTLEAEIGQHDYALLSRRPTRMVERSGRRNHRADSTDWFTDVVYFEPAEDHRHRAAPNRFMTHLAMLEVDDERNPAM